MSHQSVERYLSFSEQVVHLRDSLPDGIDATELENALSSLGVVLLYAHMEQSFRSAIENKCHRCHDAEVRAFALSVRDEKAGKIKMESVKGTLKRFGMTCQEGFKHDLETSGLQESWDSIVNQRQKIAHYGNPASITLRELRNYYEDIRRILGFIDKSLGLNAVEKSAIGRDLIVHGQERAGTSTPSKKE